MIEDYCILENCDKPEMVEAVKEFIGNGWEPLGGVNTVCIEDVNGEIVTWYVQAMIKRSAQ